MIEAERSNSGMELRDLLQDTEFRQRKRKNHDLHRESGALSRLVRAFVDHPEMILQELVDIAVESCGADSAGISLEETDQNGELHFRWVAVAGSFSQYLNGTTPRLFSPCGTCLSSGNPQLYRVSKPYYDYLGIAAEPITDGMLIPWTADNVRGTIWSVAHRFPEAFDFDDYRLLQSLSDFAAIAIRHQMQEEALRRREKQTAYIEKTNELAHQINNPLQSLTNIVYLAQQGGTDSQAYIEQASRELSSLSELVKKLLSLRTSHVDRGIVHAVATHPSIAQ